MNDIIATSKTRVEVDQDFCANRYGDGVGTKTGLCQAALGTTGERKCFNTRSGCQDPDNFTRTGLALKTATKLNSNVATVALTAPWTLEFACQRGSLTGVDGAERLLSYPMAAAGSTGSPADGFEMRIANFDAGTGLASLALDRFDAGATTWTENSAIVVPIGEPFHVEITTDGTDTFVYATGEEGRRKLIITRLASAEALASGFVHLNRTAEAEQYSFSEIRFWSRQLTDKERRRDHLRSIKIVNEELFPDGLEHYWRIDSPDEDATADLVGGGGSFVGTFTYAAGLAYRPITLRHTKQEQEVESEYLPSLLDVQTAPSRLEPGQGLGQRASGSATFADHPYGDFFIDKYRDERVSGAAQNDGIGYDPAEQGTYWAKWRARNFESFFNRELRVYQIVGATEIERNYVMESVAGPDRGNTFTINFLDPLIQLDGDRAQAPRPNTGQIANTGGITETSTSLTLKPTGIGDEEYSASGWIAVGREAMAFTRSGDTVTLDTRGALGTEAQEHDEDDSVQEVLHLQGTADVIQRTLSVDFAGVSTEFIDNDQWAQEASDHIGLNFEHFVTKPTAVSELSRAFMEQAQFNIFWDEIKQTIPFEALKNPEDLATLVGGEWIDQDTLDIREQQDKRISQVWVHYGLVDPTQRIEDGNNYQSLHTGQNLDTQGVNKWGKPKIKVVHGRFIQKLNLAAAEKVEEKILSRFSRPPRLATFQVPLWRDGQLSLAQLIRIDHRRLQRDDGRRAPANWQVQGIERRERNITIIAEEFNLFSAIGTEKKVTISSDRNDVNLRTEWEARWGAPESGDVVLGEIILGAVVGSSSAGTPAFDVGDWPAGVDITITIETGSRIAGKGGLGGAGANPFTGTGGGDGVDGSAGLLTTVAITVNNSGVIAGGGGGGGAGAFYFQVSGISTSRDYGGGGGAGRLIGAGGDSISGSGDGTDGTLTDGGVGASGDGVSAGDGGDPGQAGQDGTDNATGQPDGQGGAAGNAVDGKSFVNGGAGVTDGTVLGSQVN